jgi:hypothetical protein
LHRHKSSVGSQPPRSALTRQGNAQAEDEKYVRNKANVLGFLCGSRGKVSWREKMDKEDMEVTALRMTRGANEKRIVDVFGWVVLSYG